MHFTNITLYALVRMDWRWGKTDPVRPAILFLGFTREKMVVKIERATRLKRHFGVKPSALGDK